MKRGKRRRKKRLQEKLKKEVTSKEPSLQPKGHKQSPPNQSRARRYFERTISRTGLLSGLVVSAATLLSSYAVFRPHLSVEPYIRLNPVDPYRTQFSIKNENIMFGLHDIESVCWPRRMESGNGFSIVSPGPLQNVRHAIPHLEPGGTSTVDCPPVIGGIGTYSGQVDFAELEIVVSYRQSWWPLAITARYPFRAMRDVSQALHWAHITPAEEKPIIPSLK